MTSNPVLLIVIDGFGIAPPDSGNAIHLANPKNINDLFRSFPNTQLEAAGEAVGLPSHEAGTSEVGHLNIGAGRIVYQSLPRINLSIADGNFFKNSAFVGAIDHIAKTGGSLHLLGLIGNLNVHSSTEHLHALIHLCKEYDIQKTFVHVITDGRDSPPKAASIYLKNLSDVLSHLNIGTIASIMGRYYAMDRDNRWERVEKAYVCLTKGQGQAAASWQEAINSSYKDKRYDEFVYPTNIVKNGKPIATITEGDAVIFFNFRIDRPRELTKAFVLDNFKRDANKTSYDPYAIKYYAKHIIDRKVLNPPFERGSKIKNLNFVTMTEYERDLPTVVAFPPRIIDLPFGRVLSQNEIPQLRIAESEKERFVTYYFNGLREAPFKLEERLIIPSPKIATYDLKPEMSSYEVTDLVVKKMQEKKHRFILVNFAPADMIGHTGNMKAAISAVGAIDACLAKIRQATLENGFTTVITADHGNIEEMIDKNSGGPSTEHSINPVPFIVIDSRVQGQFIKLQTGILADVVPTILFLLNIRVPSQMTGRNLLEEISSKFTP